MKKLQISTTINSEEKAFLCDPGQTLLQILRDELDLTGSKEGCGNGNCGACNVIIDGVLVNSCLVLAAEVEGKSIQTIEGISINGELHPLQEVFITQAALQCGICTPGFLVASKQLLDTIPNPSEVEIREWLAGNLCRCTGYDKIIKAVMKVASDKQGGMSQ